MQEGVRQVVESTIGDDRHNLRISELSDTRLLNQLAYVEEHEAAKTARRAFLSRDDESGYSPTFKSTYCPEEWNDKSLLTYIRNPNKFIASEAEAYIDNHQEHMLYHFLVDDAVAAEYAAIEANPGHASKWLAIEF